MKIKLITTGDTIDEVYLDQFSEFQAGKNAVLDRFEDSAEISKA